jgi:drug/metabolite transporter (DMT)-like permease
MLLAVSCFGCLDTISKILAAHYPAPAIVWARYVLQTVAMVAIFMPRMGLSLVRTRNPWLQIVRGTVLTASSVVFVVALGYMPIAEVSSIMFMSPIFVALAGGPLLGERLHPRTWVALAGGFIGVMLIIRPGSAVFAWTALLPLCCAIFVATYQLLTRKLAGRDDPITTLFYPGVVACLAIPPLFPAAAFVLPTVPLHAAMIAAIGVLGAVGHFFLIRAHAVAPATLLAPFGYAQLVVVLVLGWLVFGQLPDPLALAGIALVASSGLGLVLAGRKPVRA